MPSRAPRLCDCGLTVPFGERCGCKAAGDADRKARHDRKRPSSSQRGYTGAWDKAKKGFLDRHPWCRFCGKAATLVDHIKPHKRDPVLFWDKSNWQPLCITCHSSSKQMIERRESKR
ncbi:HNH endonuclease [Gemmobacter aquarius]|uniref:Putative HNH nuclease YajD n=1 Tax=Paragemmobacter aquarius TaxID=2169400 RepID=A0A2S0UM72_9RHOB|nr:HNH endonuclease [Gemmobacter aquarius]AWB48891.1 HNH endonuclease [Gemmobacter aquarius]